MPEMVKAEGSHGGETGEREKKTRQRASTSCTECKRRKQKCNQTRDRPCNNCQRRYPPVECVYTNARKPPRKGQNLERVLELDDRDAKFGESGAAVIPATSNTPRPHGSTTLKANIPLRGTPEIVESRGQSTEGSASQLRRHSSHAALLQAKEFIRQDSPAGSETPCGDISHLFVINPDSRYYPYPEFSQNSYYGIMKAHFGDAAIQSLHSLPLEASRRNAELLHFFIQRLSPYMTSIDGIDPPANFMNKWVPFMIQSPLVVYIVLLTASYFQAVSRRIDVEKSVDAVAVKMKLISLINAHISSHGKGVSDEAIGAVMSLAYNELIYSDKRSTVAHMKGLREMIRTRGGIQNIGVSTLRMMLVRTDYQVACTFECDPIIQGAQEFVPILNSYPIELDSPLLLSSIRFVDSAKILDISAAAATILDDMRFVTTSLLSLGEKENTEHSKTKFAATVKWIHDRLTSSTTEPQLAGDFIYQTCRATAIIYTSAILCRTPLSLACTEPLLQQLWMMMWRVPLSRWKKTPGIFFWVLLVANPFTKDRPEGRFVKGMIAAGTMTIGLVDWDTIIASLKGFLAVQRWLDGNESGTIAMPHDRLAVSKAPDGGLPAWSLTE